MSNLTAYVAGALAALVILDHASIPSGFPSGFDLGVPAELTDSVGTVNRALKGDRCVPGLRERESKPLEGPLEVVDFPTGSVGRGSSAIAAERPNNFTSVLKRALPPADVVPRALPAGCESAFGRLATPPLATVPGRCII